LETCKKELVDLRSKLRSLYNETVEIQNSEERVMRENINNLLKSAVDVEKVITPFLEGVVSSCQGKLVGLKYRFKTRESLDRKVRGDIESKKRQMVRGGSNAHIDICSVIFAIGDTLRYTMLIPDENYCSTVLQVREKLSALGYPGIKFKNYWEKGDMYQGINDMYKCTGNNFVFELQFHTQASWDLKAESHIIYEKFRVCKDPIEMQKLFDEGTALANILNVPEGVELIPNLVRNPEPNLLSAYAQLLSENSRMREGFLSDWFGHACEGCKISVIVDDERTIESELHVMIDEKNKSIEKVVLEDYFFGVMIRIVIPNNISYVSQVEKLIRFMESTSEDSDKKIQCCNLINQWTIGDGAKCVRLLGALGSRSTTAPSDNMLFEVVIHSADSDETDEHIKILMRSQATKTNESQGALISKIRTLWEACPKPVDIEKIASTP
jgi:hypothetical protein